MFLRPSLLTCIVYAFLKRMFSSRIDFSSIGIYLQLSFKKDFRFRVFLYLYNSYHTIYRSHLSQLLDEFFFISPFYVNKYYTQVCLLSEEHCFKLPNTYHRIHISSFRKKKNYKTAIAWDTKARISYG